MCFRSVLLNTALTTILVVLVLATHSNGRITMSVVSSNNNPALLVKKSEWIYYAEPNQTIRVSCQSVDDNGTRQEDEFDVFDLKEIRNSHQNFTCVGRAPSAEFRLETDSREFGCCERLENGSSKALVEVIVGMPPEKLRRFDCVFDTKRMKCVAEPMQSWPKMSYNRTVQYSVTSRTVDCEFTLPDENSCQTDDNCVPVGYADLQFTICQTNELGSYSENHTINRNDNLTPPPVQHLTASNIQEDGAYISWQMDPGLHNYGLRKEDFVFNLKFISPYNENYSIRNNINETFYNLDGLEFGYMNYTVSIRSKVRSNYREKDWSQKSEISFRTKSRVPDTPTTDPGAFHFDDSDHLTVYWLRLKTVQKHAPSVDYQVNNKNTTNHFWYRFDGNHKALGLHITISSRSERGLSLHPLRVHVPSAADRCGVPTNLKKVLSKHAFQRQRNHYTLSWSPSSEPGHHPVDSYTVFRCIAKTESENQCKSEFNFERVNASVTSFSYDSTTTMNFAVSANCGSSVSGMSWTGCAAVEGNDIGKLNPTWLNDTTLQWKPECKDAALLTGFNLKYCSKPCTGDPVIFNVTDPNQREYTFSDLDTGHDYTLDIAGTTATTKGLGRFEPVPRARPTPFAKQFMLLLSMASACVLLIFVFGHLVYRKVKDMADIALTLPDGLLQSSHHESPPSDKDNECGNRMRQRGASRKLLPTEGDAPNEPMIKKAPDYLELASLGKSRQTDTPPQDLRSDDFKYTPISRRDSSSVICGFSETTCETISCGSSALHKDETTLDSPSHEGYDDFVYLKIAGMPQSEDTENVFSNGYFRPQQNRHDPYI